ncbi:MAG: restriction endonuclease subunit S [Clostridia bacterium]|nr:restriction endonuclease subunit S [Clostridia bacterium]
MVKEGYINTELGTIPQDWEYTTWECAGSGFTSGATPYRAIKSYYNGNIKWVSSGELNYNVIYDTIEHISEEARQKTNLKLHPSNTFLMAITGLEAAGTRGSCAILGSTATTNQSCMAVYGTEKLDIKYLYHFYVKYGNELAFRYCQGTKQQSYTAQIVKKLPIVLPDFCEQQRIAEALSEMDNLVSSLEKLIEKKKAIKQGAMQELLTGKKRLPGFDGKWKTLSLAEIGTITGSGVDKKILPDEQPITLLNYTNVYHQVFISRKDLNHQVTASAEKIKNCSVLKGDVFLTPTSETPEEIAISAVASEDMSDVVYSYHVVRLRPNTCYNGAFINYALSTPLFREQTVQFAEGSGIRYVITLKKFKEMQVHIPAEKEEQNAIVSILSDMDEEITALEQKIVKCQKLKQGMMQQLLTGKIRLV